LIFERLAAQAPGFQSLPGAAAISSAPFKTQSSMQTACQPLAGSRQCLQRTRLAVAVQSGRPLTPAGQQQAIIHLASTTSSSSRPGLLPAAGRIQQLRSREQNVACQAAAAAAVPIPEERPAGGGSLCTAVRFAAAGSRLHVCASHSKKQASSAAGAAVLDHQCCRSSSGDCASDTDSSCHCPHACMYTQLLPSCTHAYMHHCRKESHSSCFPHDAYMLGCSQHTHKVCTLCP
jgi:hypothetical protein